MPEAFGQFYVAALVLIFLGISIFVHELGHFLAARFCGMIVDTFSIGFGPAIWKKKVGATSYKLGWIPFGGYVALPQLDPEAMDKIQGKNEEGGEPRKLPRIEPWKKIVVSFSGAVGNVILAVFVAWLVYWVGIPATAAQRSAMVGFVSESSVAYQQGLRVGDLVKTVNGKPVKNWLEVLQEAALSKKVALSVLSSDGQKKSAILETVTVPGEAAGQKTLAGIYGLSLCVVESVDPGKSADKAGIVKGDMIIEFDGTRIINGDHFIDLVAKKKDQKAPIKLKRDGVVIETTVTPEFDASVQRARIGLKFDPFAILYDETIHPLPSEQLKDHASLIFRVLKALVTPKEAAQASKALGGPVAILEVYYHLISSSLMLAIWFTGMLNINLAILNLMPLPVFDGGQIVLAMWEGVARKPANPKVVGFLFNAFAMLLIGLFVLISVRDVKRATPRDSIVGRLFSRVEHLLGIETASATNNVASAGTTTNTSPAGSISTNETVVPQTAP